MQSDQVHRLMQRGDRQTAIVTGAASGIGWGIVQRLAKDGLIVVMIDRDAVIVDRAATLRDGGASAHGVQLDLHDSDRLIDVVHQVAREHGGIDALVNNAGYGLRTREGGGRTIESINLDEWNEIVGINMTAPFLLCREVVPYMKAIGRGRIVNISSRTGRTALAAADTPYAAAKAGIIGLTRNLASQVGEFGITVNAIAPGRIDTPLANKSAAGVIADAVASIPLRRQGRPDELAATVAFLLWDGGGYITGAVIDVNGGAFMG